VDTPPEDTTDEQLADLIADPDTTDQSDANEDVSAGSVEVGIPPQLNQDGDGVDSSEESFSINDFDEDFHADKPPSQDVEKEASVDLPDEEKYKMQIVLKTIKVQSLKIIINPTRAKMEMGMLHNFGRLWLAYLGSLN